jgi:NADPH:quinone reductase-like Zn-dependent oxidoreductase
MWQVIKGALLSPLVSQKFEMFLSDLTQSDLEVLSGLIQSGKIKPVIDKRYTLSEVPAAMRYLEGGHVRGKIVVGVE